MFQKILKTKQGKWALVMLIIATGGFIICVAEKIWYALPYVFIYLSIAAILIIFAVKAVKKKPPESVTEDTDLDIPHDIKLTIKTEISSRYVERFIAEGEEVSLLDLGGYKSQSGGYVNWGQYEISGTNTATGRQNTRRYTAQDETAVATMADADGLAPPYQIQVLPNEAPTERQINYLRSWNVRVPEGATKQDVSAMLSRLEDSYDTVYENETSINRQEYIRPLPGPSEEFAKYANDMGVMFSKYVGHDALLDYTVYKLKDYDRAAFFAYCVLCSYYRMSIKDLRSSEYADKLYSFAEKAVSDEALLRSICGRSVEDYKKPHKGSIAYKAVAELFALK